MQDEASGLMYFWGIVTASFFIAGCYLLPYYGWKVLPSLVLFLSLGAPCWWFIGKHISGQI